MSEKKSKSCSASTAAAGHDFRGANKGRDDPAVSHEEDRERKLESEKSTLVFRGSVDISFKKKRLHK